jgi:hypothetical protein
MDRSERHRSAPCGIIVSSWKGTVSRQQDPTFSKSYSPVKFDEIIAILSFEIAGGTYNQYWPTLS